MPTIKLIVEYDGTAYAGWQRQPGHPTIQEAIEVALAHLTEVATSVIAAGRTDAGVHALGQVVSFYTHRVMPPVQWVRALNAHLAPDITVRSAALMADTFHARHQAIGKLYEYRILNRSERPSIHRHFCTHVHKPLNDAAMNQAALRLVGCHHFTSFETQPTANDNPICHMQRLAVHREGDYLRIEAYADRFLKQMVRSIVGTLIDVGLAKRPPESLEAILAARNRSAAGRTAPPQGLFLVRVDYSASRT